MKNEGRGGNPMTNRSWLLIGALLTLFGGAALIAAGYWVDETSYSGNMTFVYPLWLGPLIGLPLFALGLYRTTIDHQRR